MTNYLCAHRELFCCISFPELRSNLGNIHQYNILVSKYIIRLSNPYLILYECIYIYLFNLSLASGMYKTLIKQQVKQKIGYGLLVIWGRNPRNLEPMLVMAIKLIRITGDFSHRGIIVTQSPRQLLERTDFDAQCLTHWCRSKMTANPAAEDISTCIALTHICRPYWVNTWRRRQNGHQFAEDIFKCTFLNENIWIWINISLKFVPKGPINTIPALVQIMAWCRPGDKPLSEATIVRLPTHICVTRPQWVNCNVWWYAARCCQLLQITNVQNQVRKMISIIWWKILKSEKKNPA